MVIADVADKGMPAALFMAMCRTLVRAAAISRTSPAETLTRVNQLLFNDSHSDLFVTALYAVWNPTTGEIVYANAGHNPPLLVSGKQSKVSKLDGHGIALGVMHEIRLDEYRVMLKPGDILVAYTDGITEAMTDANEEWGIERFIKVVKKAAKTSAKELLDRVLAALDAFVGYAAQSDDVTVWVLKREDLDSPQE
jgi:sigma-B regulation protein RsbU (phosphoserine phosphatase)